MPCCFCAGGGLGREVLGWGLGRVFFLQQHQPMLCVVYGGQGAKAKVLGQGANVVGFGHRVQGDGGVGLAVDVVNMWAAGAVPAEEKATGLKPGGEGFEGFFSGEMWKAIIAQHPIYAAFGLPAECICADKAQACVHAFALGHGYHLLGKVYGPQAPCPQAFQQLWQQHPCTAAYVHEGFPLPTPLEVAKP